MALDGVPEKRAAPDASIGPHLDGHEIDPTGQRRLRQPGQVLLGQRPEIGRAHV